MEVTRELVVPAPPDEVWDALTEPDRLREWFANSVELDLDGREGVFRWDDGEVRRARVEAVDPGRSLRMVWWDEDDPGDRSTVAFSIEEAPAGTRLVVTESADGPTALAGGFGTALELWLLLAPVAR